jgi:hypothetical protein
MKGLVAISIGLLAAAQVLGADTPVVVTDGSINLKTNAGTTLIVHPLTTVSDTGTLTSAGNSVACGSGSDSFRQGYADVTGLSFGSYSPSTLTGGKKVVEVWDQTIVGSPAGCPVPGVNLEISGFTANPLYSWLTSITCNGVKLTASSTGYSYASGVATWFWAGKTFSFSPGDKYTCVIVHNDP